MAYAVSGGLDSSALFGTAKQLIASGQFLAPEAKGYVTAILDDPNAYEADYWRDVGLHYNTAIAEVAPTKVSVEWFREWITQFRDMPDYPNGIINLNLDRQMVADGCRVQIGGIGGDEWLTGSRYYYYEALRDLDFRQLWSSLRYDAADYSSQRAVRLGVRYGLLPLLPEPLQRTVHHIRPPSRSTDASWLTPHMREIMNERRHAFKRGSVGAPIEKMKIHEQIYGPRKHLVQEINERRNAWLGLELRQPFYDPRLIQFALSVPQRVLLQGSLSKIVHRHAMQDVLPESVLQRRTKAEFSVTFREQLGSMEEEFVHTIPQRRSDWLEPAVVEQLFHEFKTNCREDCLVGASRAQLILWNIFSCDAIIGGAL